MTKHTIRPVQPAKTQPAHPHPGIPKRDEREPLPYWWMNGLIRAFADHTCLIIDFVVRWLKS